MTGDKYRIVAEDYDSVDVTFHNSYDTIEEYGFQIASFLTRLSQGQTILNIGGTLSECGYFANKGKKVTNIDVSQVMLSYIAEKDSRIKLIKENVKFYRNSNAFDAVWACRSLIHIPPEDLKVVLENIRTLLAPDGTFGCIMFINQGDVPKEEYMPEPHTEKDGITYYRVLYSAAILGRVFESAGFTVDKQEECVDKDGELSMYFELSRLL